MHVKSWSWTHPSSSVYLWAKHWSWCRLLWYFLCMWKSWSWTRPSSSVPLFAKHWSSCRHLWFLLHACEMLTVNSPIIHHIFVSNYINSYDVSYIYVKSWSQTHPSSSIYLWAKHWSSGRHLGVLLYAWMWKLDRELTHHPKCDKTVIIRETLRSFVICMNVETRSWAHPPSKMWQNTDHQGDT